MILKRLLLALLLRIGDVKLIKLVTQSLLAMVHDLPDTVLIDKYDFALYCVKDGLPTLPWADYEQDLAVFNTEKRRRECQE